MFADSMTISTDSYVLPSRKSGTKNNAVLNAFEARVTLSRSAGSRDAAELGLLPTLDSITGDAGNSNRLPYSRIGGSTVSQSRSGVRRSRDCPTLSVASELRQDREILSTGELRVILIAVTIEIVSTSAGGVRGCDPQRSPPADG